MTDRLNNLSRRNMFALTAGGASALAVGSMLGGTAFAAGSAASKGGNVKGPVYDGAATIAGDPSFDPATRALAEKLLLRMKKSMLDSTLRPGEVARTDKVAAASSKLIGTLRASRANRMKESLKPGSKFKELTDISAVQSADAHKMYAVELAELVKKKKVKVEKEKKPQWQPPLAQKIEFHLNSVRCEDTTSGPGSDEILMGGSIVTPGGVVKKIDAFKVSDGFDDGDNVIYDYRRCKVLPANTDKSILKMVCPHGDPNDVSAGRKLAFTRLNIDIPWPATIAVVLTMGEQDSGGFNQMVQDAYKALEDEIQKKLNELGVQVGTAIGGELGAVIGAVLAAVVGEFIGWLVSLFDTKDDVITSQNWIVQLNSPEMSVIRQMSNEPQSAAPGIWASPLKKLTFSGNGGVYHAGVHWRVFG